MRSKREDRGEIKIEAIVHGLGTCTFNDIQEKGSHSEVFHVHSTGAMLPLPLAKAITALSQL